MIHSLHFKDLDTTIEIDETLCDNVCIRIVDHNFREKETYLTHYLTPKDLHSFIGTLLHVQAKKTKNKKK